MKRFATLLALASFGSFAGRAQVTWSSPATVAANTYGNLHPRVVLNRAGDPMVLWGKGMNAYFSRWTGSAFSTPLALNNMSTLPVFAASWAGPDIAAFGDTVYAVMKRTPETVDTHYVYMVHSYDGGMSFSSPVRVDNIDTNKSRFPTVTTNSTGNPIVAFMKFNASFMDAQYVVSRSTDYGNSFLADVVASSTSGDVCDCCPASMVSSGSNVMTLYRNNLSDIREIWATVSTDGGMTFPTNRKIDTTNWMVTSCPSSGPDAFVIGDTLYSVFMSKASGKELVYMARTSLSGTTTTHNRIAGTVSGLLSQNYPRIANAGSHAVAVWKQNASSGNSIVASFTKNIASGLSGYTVVATGSGLMNADVVMTPGVIHLVYEDDNTGTVKYVKGTYAVPASVSELSRQEVDIYPNPAGNAFTVSLGSITSIDECYLVDAAGRTLPLVAAIKNGKATFSVDGIAKGGYYFVLHSEGRSYYSKLILQ